MEHVEMWRNEVEEMGFSIIPDMLSPCEVTGFLAALDASPLPRSRAGILHALRPSGVTELANSPKLLKIARCVLGDAALPSAQRFSTSLRHPIGWSRGIKTPLCRCRSVVHCQTGVRGQ